jgi:hypothetical protein|tara:strand:- start:1316 stop:1495 length:180 start_codon:yes stop_codon:yes gene_type:complete
MDNNRRIKEIRKADLKTINKIVMNQNWGKQLLMRECFDRALELGYKGTFPIENLDNYEV